MHNKVLVILLIFTTIFECQSQELLTKEEAVQLALKKNFNIKIAENNIRIAEGNASKDNLGYKPTVTVNAGANYNLDNPTAIFQDGREVSLNFAPSNSESIAANVNYVLFDGFNRQYNLERNQASVSVSQLNARLALESILLQLFQAYYDIARLEVDYDNLEEILSISKDRLKRAEFSFVYGTVTSLDVSNAEVDVNTDSIAILNQSLLLTNARNNLEFILNSRLPDNFDVETSVVFAPLITKEDYIDGLKATNVNLLLAASDISLSEIDERLTMTTKLPTVNLSADYGLNRSKNNPASFLDRVNSNGLTGGVSLSWAAFDGGRRKIQEQNAKINRLNQGLNYDLIYEQVLRDFENAWSDYQNRLRVWNALEQNVVTSRLNFERSEEKYRLRQITNIEFRQAQSNLINALTAQNRAKYDAKLSELLVYNIAGKIQEAVY
jgi:outer membrane protein TolC